MATKWRRREETTTMDTDSIQLIHELIKLQARRTPERTAVIWRDRRLSYSELMNEVTRLSACLRGRGVKAECVVGVCLERSLEVLIALLAVLDAGGAYLPLDPAFPTERIAFMLDDSRAHALITHSGLASRFTASTVQTLAIDRPHEWGASIEAPGYVAPTAASLAYLMYTSGSTGVPKGVMVEHRNVVNFFRGMDEVLGTEPGVWLAVTSISFDISVLELLWTLTRGFVVVIQGDEEKLTAGEYGFAEQITRHSVTHLQCTPTMAELVIRRPLMAEGLKTLRKLLVGGEPLPAELADSLRRLVSGEVHNMYGPTETTIWSTTAAIRAGEAVTIGRPILNTQICIVRDDGCECPRGEIGEIFIGGDGVARGYWQRPELTAQRFVDLRFEGEAARRFYRTGDLARYREDGNIEFHGRVDHQIKLRGYRVELGEVEAILGGHPAVAQVVVCPYGQAGSAQLAAYLVLEPECAVTQDELREFARNKLPDYMIPAVYAFLPGLPLTPNGKIDRNALPKPNSLSAATTVAESAAPATTLETTIADVFNEALGVAVGLERNFFEMGATSLVIAEAAATLADRLHQPLKITDLFAHPTVKALALFVGNHHHLDHTSQRAADRGAARRAALARRRAARSGQNAS